MTYVKSPEEDTVEYEIVYAPLSEWELSADFEFTLYPTKEDCIDALKAEHEKIKQETTFKECWDAGLYGVGKRMLYRSSESFDKAVAVPGYGVI